MFQNKKLSFMTWLPVLFSHEFSWGFAPFSSSLSSWQDARTENGMLRWSWDNEWYIFGDRSSWFWQIECSPRWQSRQTPQASWKRLINLLERNQAYRRDGKLGYDFSHSNGGDIMTSSASWDWDRPQKVVRAFSRRAEKAIDKIKSIILTNSEICCYFDVTHKTYKRKATDQKPFISNGNGKAITPKRRTCTLSHTHTHTY